MKLKITKKDKKYLSYISGTLLGDGCIIHQHGRKPRFQFIHTSTDYQWCKFCYEQLRLFIPLYPPVYRKIKDERVTKGYTESYMVQSRTSDIISNLDVIWYPDGKKIVPIDFLYEFLDERTLAWWYMDDGHLKVENGLPRKIIISTDNFETVENQKLIELLYKKFSIKFSLDGQNRLVLYDSLQLHYFHQLVKPLMHPSMKRKMINVNQVSNRKLPKRTSIYLPEEISILKPTSDINNQLNYLPYLYEKFRSRDTYLYFYKNYLIQLKEIKNTKSYQISIHPKHWDMLIKINKLTGLNISQIVSLCFLLNMHNNTNRTIKTNK